MIRVMVSAAGLAISAVALADTPVYDQMTNQPGVAGGSSWSVPAGGGSAASTGNRYLGVPITIAGSDLTITGFDATLLNNSGAAITFQPGWQVACNYWIWNTWTPSNTAAPAFTNLAGNGSVPFTFNAPLTLNNNTFLFITQNVSPGPGITPPAGTLPGIPIAPTTVASAGTIGIVMNWKINRQDGNGFVELGGLTQVIVGGAFAPPPVIGTNDFAAPNFGYYRSASAENNGNFLGSSSRQIGANSGMMIRVYVPTPGSLALLGLGGFLATRRRR